MSRGQRIGLIVAAVVVAVVGFAIASPGGDDDAGGEAARTTPAQTETEEEPPPPPEPEVHRVELRGGEVVGGAQDITVTSGEVVRIVVSSDAPDDIHLHGYDVEKPAGPGAPARFRFKADLEGSFEIESHVAEDAGREPLVARLNVEPD
jgi:hypothetical protein